MMVDESMGLTSLLSGPTSAADGPAPQLRALLERHPVRAGLVGESAAVSFLLSRIVMLARCIVPVLVEGEVGSGKENVARALHLNSPRSAGPFVAEAGALLTEEFLPRSLFGHQRGAFTGATASMSGLLAAADGGTLYLDEVADVPLAVQGCLLRAIDSGEYRPLGSSRCCHADIRVVASTTTDLKRLVAVGAFRRDLYFRIRGAVLRVPPLRSRKADIPSLAEHILAAEGRRLGRTPLPLTPGALRALAEHGWPGNVRELRNELLLAEAHAQQEESPAIDVLHLHYLREAGLPPERRRSRRRPLIGLLDRTEAAAIRDAMRSAGGNKTAAARALGLTRRTLYRRLRALGLLDEQKERGGTGGVRGSGEA